MMVDKYFNHDRNRRELRCNARRGGEIILLQQADDGLCSDVWLIGKMSDENFGLLLRRLSRQCCSKDWQRAKHILRVARRIAR